MPIALNVTIIRRSSLAPKPPPMPMLSVCGRIVWPIRTPTTPLGAERGGLAVDLPHRPLARVVERLREFAQLLGSASMSSMPAGAEHPAVGGAATKKTELQATTPAARSRRAATSA